MIETLFPAPAAAASLFAALVLYGFAPGMVLAAIVRLIPDVERRLELQAELYEVPRWERPFWVAEQLEVAIRLGLCARVAWSWGKHVWHRPRLENGVKLNRKYPDTFWIPGRDEKSGIAPGDTVKLMWSAPRLDMAAERLWVRVTHRRGDRLVGFIGNYPILVHLAYGEEVKFHIDDIIDFMKADDGSVDPSTS